MNQLLSEFSATQLRQAAALKERIEALERQLSHIGSSSGTKRNLVSVKNTARTNRRMSDAARERLSMIAKARWKKAKAAGKKAL